ncbi:hypothetical protein CWR48_04610 [Oceanobacillus arenosus]|uniref:Uncharacterized protein n=1 Tax=Oceanobacillus arenosus TaxID=1229153 RepID=A0A3D8PYF9_9BACI|nr:hypothetical protein [Oceanobacillus arenosus]RDW20832.1 hypothetical protein CWR48_04610 [Oceanobacillus arenosus]
MSEELTNMESSIIWQQHDQRLNNHEQRLTTLEVTMTGLSTKLDNVDLTIKEGNKEQKEKLDVIDNRLLDEFFYRQRSNQDSEVDIKKINQENKWKLWLKITGILTGSFSFIYVLFEFITTKFF